MGGNIWISLLAVYRRLGLQHCLSSIPCSVASSNIPYLKEGGVDPYSKNCNGGIKVITCLAQWRMHTPPLPNPHSFCVCKASKMLRRPIHLLTLAGYACPSLLQMKCDADTKFSARLSFKLHFQCSSNEALAVDSTSRCSFKSPLRPSCGH